MDSPTPLVPGSVLVGPVRLWGGVARTVVTEDGGIASESWSPDERAWVRDPAPPVVDVSMSGSPLKPEELAAWGIPSA
jgi:hypothetical protein